MKRQPILQNSYVQNVQYFEPCIENVLNKFLNLLICKLFYNNLNLRNSFTEYNNRKGLWIYMSNWIAKYAKLLNSSLN